MHRSPSPLDIDSAPVQAVRSMPARWIGVPAQGEACPFTSLQHAYFHSKLLKGPFSRALIHLTLRSCDESKGKRLLFLPALHRLLLDVADKSLRVDARGNLTGGNVNRRFQIARESGDVPQKWLRPPVHGETCHFTSLSHGGFYRLMEIAGSELITCSLRLPGESRAVSLVFMPSLHEYLVGLAEAQAQGSDFHPARDAA